MRRKLAEFLMPGYLKQLILFPFYLPLIVLRIENWQQFLNDYISLEGPGRTYIFKNGMKVRTGASIDAATVQVVFIRKEYGEPGEGSTVIDIGANIGTFTVLAASVRGTKVYAYEPFRESFNLLMENVRLNRLKNVVPCCLAVASGKMRRRLFIRGGSPFNSFYSGGKGMQHVEVECISLKDIFERNKIGRCDLLKLDCEGAEYEILLSTPKKYLQKVTEIRMEVHSADKNQELFAYLGKSGFVKKKTASGSVWLERV